jgi:hypothetical protein
MLAVPSANNVYWRSPRPCSTGVVEMAIDTVLMSFCKDCKIHGGQPKFAPPLLTEVGSNG